MTETTDHLAAVKAAARKAKRADQRAEAARQELRVAVHEAMEAGIRPMLIIDAAKLPRATYYRYVTGGSYRRIQRGLDEEGSQ